MDYALDNETIQKLINNLHMIELRKITLFRYSVPQARMKDLNACNQSYQTACTMLREEQNQRNKQEGSPALDYVWNSVRAGIRYCYEMLKGWDVREIILKKIDEIRKSKSTYDSEHGVFEISNDTEMFSKYETPEEFYAGVNKQIDEIISNQISKTWSAALMSNVKSFDRFSKNIIPIDRYTYQNAGAGQLQMLKYMRYFGAAMFVFALGVVAWQTAQSQNLTKTGVELVISVGGAWIGGALGEMGGYLLFGWVTSGPIGLAVGGILGGLIGAFSGGLAAESLFEAMLNAFFYAPEMSPLSETLFSGPMKYELSSHSSINLHE